MSKKLRVTASVLNLRSAPRADAPLAGQIVKGVEVETVDPSPWVYVRLASGVQAWAHGAYLSEAVEAPHKAPAWRAAKSLEQLRAQIDKRAPKRSKTFDGTVGDDAHASRDSDHNPSADGVVLAMDVTHDPAHGMDMATVAETLRVSQDPRIAFVIHNKRIFSSTVQPWKWRKYSGADPHLHHGHVSVVHDPSLYDSVKPWAI